MSYSRFSHSCWYTFWCSTDSPKMEDQIFSVCPVIDFTYAQLKSNLTKCVHKAVELDEHYHDGNKMHTKEEIQELRRYMKEFMKEVEIRYKEREDEKDIK